LFFLVLSGRFWHQQAISPDGMGDGSIPPDVMMLPRYHVRSAVVCMVFNSDKLLIFND